MSRYFRFLMCNSRWILGLYLLLSILAVSQLGQLRLDISPRSFAIEDAPERAFYAEMAQTFGSDEITVVLLRDPALFSPAKLMAIQQTLERLRELPFVKKVESLLTLPDLRVVDDQVLTEPFFAEPPDSEEATAEILARAKRNPLVLDNLLSADEQALAVNLYILQGSVQESQDNARIADAIETAIAPLRGELAGVFQLGRPYIRNAVSEQVRSDQRLIMPAALAVLFSALLLVLRRPYAMLMPMLTSGLSILWVLGFLAAIGQPLTIMTALVPLILIIVGSTEDIHLVTEHLRGIGLGYNRARAVRYMLNKMGLAVILTALTSALGFLSVALNPVQLVREFGLVTSAALAVNFLITFTLLPILLQRLGERSGAEQEEYRQDRRTMSLARVIGVSVLSHRFLYLGGMFVLVLIGLYGARNLYVNNSLLEYFSPGDPIRLQAAEVAERLSGVETFSITLDGHLEGAFDKPRYLDEIARLQRFVAAQPGIDFSASIVDYLSILNSVVSDDAEYYLPEEEAVISMLLAVVGPDEYKHYLTADHSRANIILRHHLSSSRQLNEVLARIREFVREELDPALDVEIFGDSILSSNATDELAIGQVKSLVVMLIVIFAIVSLLFANPVAGLVAMVPNIFPLVLLFGAMGYGDIPLDTGTSIIAAITIGIGVDHTMHFMVRYNESLRGIDDPDRAIYQSIALELLPMTAASGALAAGLATLCLSSFKPIVFFGLLSSMAMLVAFAANILILPALLHFVRLTTIWELFSLPIRRDLLADCPLVQGMGEWQARRLFRLGEVRGYLPGEAIMREGEPAEATYILLEGEVDVIRSAAGAGSKVHSAVGVGNVFGVGALIGDMPRTATAVAMTPVRVMVLRRERLQRLSRLSPRLAAQLTRNAAYLLAQRLRAEREADRQAADRTTAGQDVSG